MWEPTKHYLLFGDCTKTTEIYKLPPVDLLVTSPPYFNAPFDYKELFSNYENFLELIHQFGKQYFKALKSGAITAINIDDMLIEGIKYPIISDTIKILAKIGFKLKGRIIWKKPEGYIRISQRSGVLLQNPYPMYFYPDNLLESIIIFQKPWNNERNSKSSTVLEDIWEMTNVLPIKGRLETNIAAFPDDLPKKFIEMFTQKNSVVCDPFLGSGTTMKVARQLKRNSIGVEILEELEPVIREKTGFTPKTLDTFILKNPDKLIIKKIKKEEVFDNDSIKKKLSLLSTALKNERLNRDNLIYHLLLMDLRDSNENILNESLSGKLRSLYPGRIVIVFYDPIYTFEEKIRLNEVTDFMFKNGLRLRDKITIRHKPEKQWNVVSPFDHKIIFNHIYYEVLIFQNGKFDYNGKSKEEKKNCLINKGQFQKEKWFLTLWDFKSQKRIECDPIVISRFIELFLYNNEIVGSNFPHISCPKRKFISENFS